MKDYTLINPKIVGEFDSTTNAKNENEAMANIWHLLGAQIEGNVPSFYTTLQEGKGGELHHFKITEKVKGSVASSNIEKVDLKLGKKDKQAFLKQVEKVGMDTKDSDRQSGGRKRGDDSSSSSDSDSDSEYYNYLKYRKNLPITLSWYAPLIYSQNRNFDLYIPVWRRPHFVYNQLWFGYP